MKFLQRLLAGVLILTVSYCSAQGIQMSGQVKDSLSVLPGATVAIFAKQNKAIAETLTDSVGCFNLQVKEHQVYRIEISYSGYEVYKQSFNSATNSDLGTLTLRQLRANLQEVVVQSRQPVLEIGKDPNTLIYNVAGTADAAGQTALETLKKAPGVSIDNNSRISLNGRTGVTIMLDGKMTYLSGRELVDLLQAMPSSSIKSIEIINSPGAKYDAAGTAGIINIRTIKIMNAGLNGSIGSGLSYGITLKQNTDLSLNYRRNKLTWFLSYNHFVGINTYEYGTDRLQNNRNYSSDTYDKDKRKRVNTRLGMDYVINAKHSIGWMFNAGFIPGGGLTQTRTAISLPGSAVTDQLLDAFNDYYYQHTQRYNGTINYQYEDKAGHKLNIDADLGHFKKGNKNFQSNRYLDASETLLKEIRYRTFNEIVIRLKAVKADYTAKLGKGVIETGGKLAGVQSVNDGQFYHIKQTDSLDKRRSNYFSFRETIGSAYVNFKQSLKKWSWQAGLRIEHTSNKSDTTSRNYTNLFPAISIGFKPRNEHNFSLAYSRRIDRPAYPDLNPFIYLLDELSYWQGNPYLQPQLTDRLSAQYVYRSATVLGLNYAQTDNYSARITDSINGNQLVMIPRNVGKQQSWSFTIAQNLTIRKWWEVTFNASVLRLHNEIAYAKNINYELTQWAGRGNLVQRFRINPTFTAEVAAYYNGRRLGAANEISRATSQVDIALQKTIGTHAIVRLALNDFYKGNQFRSQQDMDQFHIRSYGYYETRQVRLNFTWKLIDKNSKAPRVRSSALEAENGRVR